LAANGLANIAVKQSFQPTNQGANLGATIYINKIGDKRLGFLRRNSVWIPLPSPGRMEYEQMQIVETTFQISALSIQIPSNVVQLTASDICEYAADILQGDTARETLQTKGVQMLRVTDIRNPYFMDDKERFEASPSFDFTLMHERVIISTTPVVETYEFNVKRI
jgi:hypothetical protein